MSRSIRRAMIDRDHQQLSLVRQCILLESAGPHYRSVPTRAEDLELMALGPSVFEDPLLRLQEDEGLAAATGLSGEPKKGSKADAVDGSGSHLPANTSKPAPGHRIFPYLLKGVEVNRVDQVWAADITYIPMAKGFLYLVAIMDGKPARAGKLSNTMDPD